MVITVRSKKTLLHRNLPGEADQEQETFPVQASIETVRVSMVVMGLNRAHQYLPVWMCRVPHKHEILQAHLKE